MSDVMVFTDPSIDGPKLAFTTGATSNGQAVINPVLPNIPGNLSSWKVSEWSQPSYLDPASVVTNSSADADPLYGNTLYFWQAANSQTALSIYSENGTSAGPYVYDLQEAGVPNAVGGADLFLSANALIPSATFNHPITFSMDAKLVQAVASYNSGAATSNSAVLSQLFAGFTVTFNAPGTSSYDAAEATFSVFLQIQFGTSQHTAAGQPPVSAYVSATPGSSPETLIYTGLLPGDPYLPFASATGEPTSLSYNLNDYLDNMISLANLPSYTRDLGQWTLGSMYVGIEAENGLSSNMVAGSILTNLQLSNINVTTDPNQTVAYSGASGAGAQPPPDQSASLPDPTLFVLSDSANGMTQSITSDGYTGPLSFMSHGDAYSYNGADAVQISAQTASNPLMATGSGNDVLTGAPTGSSILDGGTGANIETDGGSGNTTFVQNGYVAGQTWDFLQNVHGADEDIIFGYIPGISKIAVQEGGAGAYTGATVTILPGNGNSEAVTFVGASTSSIQGCSAVIEGVPSWVLWTSES